MKTTGKSLSLLFSLMLVGSSAHAALLSRASGQAWYDTVLDVTWVADANLAVTNTFGLAKGTGPNPAAGKIGTTGLMSWSTANQWIAGMNSAAYLGKSDWRMPGNLDLGEIGCSDAAVSYVGGDCGWNTLTKVGPTVYSELADLFYDTLQNKGSFNTEGVPNEDCFPAAPVCLSNPGPFANIDTTSKYWFGSDPVSSDNWVFSFGNGAQNLDRGTKNYHVLALRSGDIEAASAVPVPGVAWLLGGAFAMLGRRALRGRAGTTGG